MSGIFCTNKTGSMRALCQPMICAIMRPMVITMANHDLRKNGLGGLMVGLATSGVSGAPPRGVVIGLSTVAISAHLLLLQLSFLQGLSPPRLHLRHKSP